MVEIKRVGSNTSLASVGSARSENAAGPGSGGSGAILA